MKLKLLSHIQFLATPWTAAYQALPSMDFPGKSYWSELILNSPLITVEPTFRYHVLALLGSCSEVGMPQIKSLEPLSLNIEFRFYRMCVMIAVLRV